jgi:hypothetical protein
MTARLAQYAATAVAANFSSLEGDAQCVGRSSAPALFNGTWTPWCP